MKFSTFAALAVGALALSTAPLTLASQPITLSFHSQSQSDSTFVSSGEYTLQVSFADYDGQLAGKKVGKKLTIIEESPPKPCTASDFAGAPEKLFRTFEGSGCQILDHGKTVAFRTNDGDFALAMVEGSGKARHVVIRDSGGKMIWERSGSAAYFVRAGGFRCKTTVTSSADPAFKQEFSGRCYPFVGREIANGVVMVTDSGSEVLIDVSNNLDVKPK